MYEIPFLRRYNVRNLLYIVQGFNKNRMVRTCILDHTTYENLDLDRTTHDELGYLSTELLIDKR